MSIKILQHKCISCGKCEDACPGNLLGFNENEKAAIQHPKDCWGCTACVKECNVGAIRYYLGSDIGGNGGYLFTTQTDEYINWHIVTKGDKKLIKILKIESNEY